MPQWRKPNIEALNKHDGPALMCFIHRQGDGYFQTVAERADDVWLTTYGDIPVPLDLLVGWQPLTKEPSWGSANAEDAKATTLGRSLPTMTFWKYTPREHKEVRAHVAWFVSDGHLLISTASDKSVLHHDIGNGIDGTEPFINQALLKWATDKGGSWHWVGENFIIFRKD